MALSWHWLIALALALVAAVPAAAAVAAAGGDLFAASVLSATALLGALLAHWGLRRLGRRLPRLLARRSGTPISPAAPLPWEQALELGLLVPKIAIWLWVVIYVTDQFDVLQRVRVMLAHALVMSVTAPLFKLNDRGYSALNVLELPAVLTALWIAVSGLIRVLKTQVLRAARIEPGVQDAVALLSRYTLMFLGTIVILQIWGIDASSLTFVASVLGVGIGFGLQHIANNFVSGLVVSLERPIQPGDFVKVGEWMGTVERIGPRNTEVRTLDGVSILVPNSRFLETEVVNWTHRDPVSRLHVPVSVAYGSDVGRVRAALLDAATGHPDVLKDPRPRVEFSSFGESALHFDLQVWMRDPRIQFRLASDLNYRIDANLRRFGIQVPFPQRDLHLRSPQLEQLLNVWSRRHFTAAELVAANGQQEMPHSADALPDLPSEFEPDPGPQSWTDEQIDSLVARMRGPDGVAIADRRHLLTVYRRCFVGREAVDWMIRSLRVSRQEAVMLGWRLTDRGAIHHVLDEHGFEDGHFFYRFREDEPLQRAASRIPM